MQKYTGAKISRKFDPFYGTYNSTSTEIHRPVYRIRFHPEFESIAFMLLGSNVRYQSRTKIYIELALANHFGVRPYLFMNNKSNNYINRTYISCLGNYRLYTRWSSHFENSYTNIISSHVNSEQDGKKTYMLFEFVNDKLEPIDISKIPIGKYNLIEEYRKWKIESDEFKKELTK